MKLDTCYYQNIKNGKDIKSLDDGRLIPEPTFNPFQQWLRFCSDTVYNERNTSYYK
jgi:ribonuclease Z